MGNDLMNNQDNNIYDKNLAVMMLTHNHYQTVDEILGKNLEYYHKYNIDVYVCDDSDDEGKTKGVVEDYQKKGFDNVFFSPVTDTDDGNEKYFRAVRQDYTNKKYKYVFPIKDRAYFSERIIKSVSEIAQDDFDVIMVVQDFDRWNVHLPEIKYIYNDAVEFFEHYGQLTTNWRTMVFNTSTIANAHNLDKFNRTYHLGAASNFAQPIITFAGLAEIANPRINVIHAVGSKDIGESVEFNSGSGWFKMVFELWLDRWIKAIYSLPSIYNQYKPTIIKAETNLNVLFGSVDGLKYHKYLGTLTKEVFDKYRPNWRMVSNVPEKWVDYIINDQDHELIIDIFKQLHKCLQNRDYENAFYIVVNNKWLKEVVVDYEIVLSEFENYRFELYLFRKSERMDGVESLPDLVKKARERETKEKRTTDISESQEQSE